MKSSRYSFSSLCVMLGHITFLTLLLLTQHRSSAESAVSDAILSPGSASSLSSSSSSFSSSNIRQKRAPGWGKRSGSDDTEEDELDGASIFPAWDYYTLAEKRAPGWGKREPGWAGKRLEGMRKRAPGWGKRAPGWGKRDLDLAKRAPGWGKRAPGWGKRASGSDYCQRLEEMAEDYARMAQLAAEKKIEYCGSSAEANEMGRK